MSLPKLLDLFCCSGGASKGYAQAGFDVTGVDHFNRPRYPYQFRKADVFDVLQDRSFIDQFDVIAASPPCQFYSSTSRLSANKNGKLDLLTPLLDHIYRRGGDKIWVIENVPEVPFPEEHTIILCGSMFPQLVSCYDPRRQLRRHRKFHFIGADAPVAPVCQHNGFRPLGVYGVLNDKIPGGGSTASNMHEARSLMDIDWMLWRELREAIPPAYTHFVGQHLMEKL